jgi:hypothetical protein
MAAVTAVRPAPRHEFFPAKADATAPTVTCDNSDLGFVDKFH